MDHNPEVIFQVLKTVPWVLYYNSWHPRMGHGIEMLYPGFYGDHTCIAQHCITSDTPPSSEIIKAWIKDYKQYYKPTSWTPKNQ